MPAEALHAEAVGDAVLHQLLARVVRDAALRGTGRRARNATETMKSQAEAAGISVGDVVLFPETATDATPQMQKVAESNPEAIVMWGFTPTTRPVIAARTKLG